MASNIELLLEQPELIARLGAAAYSEAQTRDPDRIARHYEDLYQSLLGTT